MEKRCVKCQTTKSVAEFYRHPTNKGGYLGRCKECAKTDRKANYERNHDAIRAKDKERNRAPARREAKRKSSKLRPGDLRRREYEKYYPANRYKYYAHDKVKKAIKRGVLTRLPCAVCGNARTHGHHEDYSRPLDVVWLCAVHHAARHLELKARAA